MLIDIIEDGMEAVGFSEVLELNEAHRGETARYFRKINDTIWLYSDQPITHFIAEEWKTENCIA